MKSLDIIFLDFDDIKNPILGGGQAKTTLEIGKRLSIKGHKIIVYCSRFPGYQDRKENGITYKHIGLGSRNIRLNNLVYILVVPFYVKKMKANIIVECFTSPISTLFSPVFTKIPVIGLGTSFDAERLSKVYHLPFTFIEKFGCKFYKYFIAYNPNHKEKIMKLNNKIIAKTIPEGVEKEFLELKKQKQKHILFVGRLDVPQKGIDLLLEAYAQIKDKIHYPLIIAGAGPDERKIKKMIKKLNLQKKVKMVGPIYGTKKIKLLSESVFVTISSRSESFSLFTLEALASGLPVVIFDIPGLSWVRPEVCLRAKPLSVDSYAKQLLSMSNSKKLNKMKLEARSFAKQFTWEKVTNEFEKFFYEVLSFEGGKNVSA